VRLPRLPSLCARSYVASLSRPSHSSFEILAIVRSPQISFCTTTSNDLSRFPLSRTYQSHTTRQHHLATMTLRKIISNATTSCHTLFSECELARLRTSYPRSQPVVSDDQRMPAFGCIEPKSLAPFPSRMSF
jgi:hypothetical protein